MIASLYQSGSRSAARAMRALYRSGSARASDEKRAADCPADGRRRSAPSAFRGLSVDWLQSIVTSPGLRGNLRSKTRRTSTIAAIIALIPCPSAAQLIVHADRALRGVPLQLIGANLTSYSKSGNSTADWAPCCLRPAAMLPQPVALWRTPGGILGDFFHINGLYDNDPAHFANPGNGVDMVHWLKVADQLRGGLLHILNINATDQELVNEIEYLNSPVPPKPGADWTKTKWRFDQEAPEGYFAWLRGQHGHAAPAGVRHVEIGNEIWNFYNDTDNRCKHDATCYGVQSAALIKKLKAKDPPLQVGVSILTIGQGANKGYRAPRIYQDLAAAGTNPDFVFDHAYYNCGYTKEDAAQASFQAGYADVLLTAAATNRRELTAAFPACGNSIGMFFDE